MKELSLNILDIAMNSVAAKATLINITLEETEDTLTISISDNGCGMTAEKVANVTDPFYTSRKTRKVGLGIPFFKLAAEQTGGSLTVKSRAAEEYPDDHGTVTSAVFNKKSIDFTPLGDVVSTICTLIQGSGDIEIVYLHKISDSTDEKTVGVDTRELRTMLGDVPLSTPEVLTWIDSYLREQYEGSPSEE